MAMRAFSGPQRRGWILQVLHRWTGLSAGVFVLIAGLTGAILAFEKEIDAWLNEDVWYVVPSGQPLPLSRLVATVESAYPKARVSALALHRAPGETQRIVVTSRGEEGLPFNQVWVDPYRGTILGQRMLGVWSLDRRHLVPLVHQFHATLTLGLPGMLFMGSVALVWLLTTLLGLYLAWPKRGRWRQVLSIKISGGMLRMLYDAHRVVGLAVVVLIGIVAFSGFIMNLRPVSLPLIDLFSSMPGEPVDAMPDLETPAEVAADLDSLVRRAGGEANDMVAAWMTLNHAKGIVTVELERPEDRSPHREIHVYFDSLSGKRVGSYDTAQRTRGEAFFRWQWALHGGDYFGTPGRIMIALLGLLPVPLLTVTGLILWWRRRRPAAS